jgi:Mn2+/Fe2+ NRAMP family transporter
LPTDGNHRILGEGRQGQTLSRRLPILAVIGPGILVAATGVGAGDVLTASLAGSRHGLTLLWAAWLGALLKWFLTEGIGRWQMATGTTVLEGWAERLGQWIRWVFLGYLLIWTFFVGGALVNACGVAGTAILPLTDNLRTSKIAWGVIHSLVGLALVRIGGFKLFERLMSLCIGVMFVAAVATAILIGPDWTEVSRGLLVPRIPEGGLGYLLGVLGGVGGTVTMLSYGYWIREKGRSGAEGVRTCRFDLTVGYTLTALFGIAMVIIGSRVRLEQGPTIALELAGQLEAVMGPAGKWIFLAGFWGAVFSSLLGVWQSAPYFFADFLMLNRGRGGRRLDEIDFAGTAPYRIYLVLIALVPLPLLWLSVERAQLIYAVLGSLFMPLLALTLLMMNSRAEWVGARLRNGWLTNLVLAATLAFFTWVALRTALANLSRLGGT